MATANPTDKSTFHKVSDSMAEKVANLTRTFQAMERSSKESSEKPKSELLKMVATGKGIGYVALKNIKIGTLILDEKPQIFTEGTAPESKFFKSLSESFKNLQLDDQEKYLKLYNRFEKTDLLKEISNIQTSGGGWTTSRGVIGEENPFIKVEKILKGSLDSIKSPSVKIQTMVGKVCLRCKCKTLVGFVNIILENKKFVDITQQCFALLVQVNFPAHNLNFH